MPRTGKCISLKLSEREQLSLEAYCQKMQRNQSEVLRDFIRSLDTKASKS